jgi:hypothetical protein
MKNLINLRALFKEIYLGKLVIVINKAYICQQKQVLDPIHKKTLVPREQWIHSLAELL